MNKSYQKLFLKERKGKKMNLQNSQQQIQQIER